jgi:hypothetical protein
MLMPVKTGHNCPKIFCKIRYKKIQGVTYHIKGEKKNYGKNRK